MNSTPETASNANSSLQPEPEGYRNRLILSLYGAFFVVVLALIGYAVVTKQGTVLAAWDEGVKKALVSGVAGLTNLFKPKQIAESQPEFESELTWKPTGSPVLTPTSVPVKPNQNRISVKTSGSSKVNVKIKTNTGSANYSYNYTYPTPKPGEPGSAEWEANFQRQWNEMSAQNAQVQKNSEARRKEFDAQWQQMQANRETFMKEWNAMNSQIKGN